MFGVTCTCSWLELFVVIWSWVKNDAAPFLGVEELVRKMNKPEELLKEKLLKKLQWGMLAFILGVGMIGYGIYLNCNLVGGSTDPLVSISIGLVLLAVGIAFLANYQIGKKMLAKEMEAEERNLRQA